VDDEPRAVRLAGRGEHRTDVPVRLDDHVRPVDGEQSVDSAADVPHPATEFDDVEVTTREVSLDEARLGRLVLAADEPRPDLRVEVRVVNQEADAVVDDAPFPARRPDPVSEDVPRPGQVVREERPGRVDRRTRSGVGRLRGDANREREDVHRT
jgi:hypothetical protein